MVVVPGFHMAEMTRGGRVYLLVDGATCVLVDTGSPDGTLGVGQLLASALRKPFEVRLILLTHAHRGHAGNLAGLRELTGAPIACSREAADQLADPPVSRRGLAGRLVGRGEQPSPIKVDRILEDGELIGLAGGIDVVAAPGHEAGCLAFHVRAPDVLCAGDAVSVDVRGVQPPPARRCADPEMARRTAVVLAERGARVVAPGHGFPSVDGRLPAKRRG